MHAHNPLEDKERLGNPDYPIPVSFYYGDIDWMDIKGGERVVEANKFNGISSFVYTVSKSDHHMYLDNPEEFAQLIIEDLDKFFATQSKPAEVSDRLTFASESKGANSELFA